MVVEGNIKPGFNLTSSYFQNLLVQPVRQAMSFMPTTQTQVQTYVGPVFETDKNIAPSASSTIAPQWDLRPESTSNGMTQPGAAQAVEAQDAEDSGNNVQDARQEPRGSDGQGPPDGNSPPGRSPPPPDESFPRRQSRKTGKGSGGGGGSDGGGGGGGGSSSSNSGSSGSEPSDDEIDREIRRNHRRLASKSKSRYKEEEFKCPPIPEPGRYRAWLNTVYQNGVAASGRLDDKALVWLMQAADEKVLDEALYDVPKSFRSRSRRITAKLQSSATGELGRQITSLVEDWLRQGRSAPAVLLLRKIS